MTIHYCTPFSIIDQPSDRESVLLQIAEAAARHPSVKARRSAITAALQDRENVFSTAVGHGVAIPHCTIAGMQDFVLGLFVYRSGVDFGAPDAVPVRLFFYILGPPEARTQHVQLLASISRAARDQEFRNLLVALDSEQELFDAVQSRIALPQDQAVEAQCRFRIYLPDSESLQDLVYELSAWGAASLSVTSVESASTYLERVPLFASLWSSKESSAIRVIEGYVRRSLANDVVRRVSDHTEGRRGVMVTVEELLVVHGSLEL